MTKLGLGTVQFGQAYGVSNRRGKIPATDAAILLARAAKGGVRVLDTAANYGDAEQILERLGSYPFRIVTKTIGVKSGVAAVVARARQSAQTLPHADTLLVHAASDLVGQDGEALWTALRGLRDEGVFARIGVSAYAGDDPAALAARFKPDVMQLPFSLLDQRLLADGTLARLHKRGIEIHARSLFLQGLLFLDALPLKLRHAAPQLADIRARITAAGSTPLAAALGFVLSRPEIAIGLVGVTSPAELDEILAATSLPLPDLDWPSLALSDETVLTPSRW